MRPAQRPPEPAILKKHGKQWSASCASKRAKDPKHRIQWKKYQGKPVNEHLLPDLIAMTQDHCSYCDGYPLDDTGFRTIDHFLPKGTYPHLTYDWKNLYLTCNRCQLEKARRFDGWVTPNAYQNQLLRPDENGYTFERYFVFNYKNGHIEPNPQASAADRERAEFTIDKFGLNEGGTAQIAQTDCRRLRKVEKNRSDNR